MSKSNIIKNKIKKKQLRHCGVPQCQNYLSSEVSMHMIPKHVLSSKLELGKWAAILRMKTAFPQNFFICSEHFDKKQVLTALVSGKKRLVTGAFPSRNLPESSISTSKSVNSPKKILQKARTASIRARTATASTSATPTTSTYPKNKTFTNIDQLQMNNSQNTVKEYVCRGVQCAVVMVDKAVQVNLNCINDISALWDTDERLYIMTGIPSIKTLDLMENMCRKIRPREKCPLSFRTRIMLTMFKVKTNSQFDVVGIMFQISSAIVKRYFRDTIKLLAIGMKDLILWQSRKQNKRKLPIRFQGYTNVRTVLDCKQIKTLRTKCIPYKKCTYLYYRSAHRLKVLIGVSPSGEINYLSDVVIGKYSDKPMFDLTNLITKFKSGDAAMVNKESVFSDELSRAGVEIIIRPDQPDMLFEKFSDVQIETSTKIAPSKFHVRRRIVRLNEMKSLSETICSCVTPYINEILIIASALSNIPAPIMLEFSDDDSF